MLRPLHAGLHEVFRSRRFMRRSFEPTPVGHKLPTVAPLFLEQARMIFFHAGSAFRTDGKRLALSLSFREERQRKQKSRCPNHKLADQCIILKPEGTDPLQRSLARRRAGAGSTGKKL